MSTRWKRGEHPDEGRAQGRARTFAEWAAYSLVLTGGVLLFGVSPDADTPVGPPTRHGVHPPAKVELGPAPRACTSQRGVPALCGHQHPSHEHATGHGAHKRLSPKELSLAKW